MASIITSVAGFLGIVVALPNWEEVKNKMFHKNAENAVANNYKISQILEELAKCPEVKKAVLIKIHNGGMKIMAGDAIYGTIIYPSLWRSTFDRQLLDCEYQEKVVYPLLKHRKTWVNIKDLSGHLRSIFSVQNVKCSLCYFIKIMPEKFFFVAVDFEVEDNEISDNTKDEIRKAVNEVRIMMQ